jgi:hypothetical protein
MMLLKKSFFLFSIHQKPECLNEYIVGFEIALCTEYVLKSNQVIACLYLPSRTTDNLIFGSKHD